MTTSERKTINLTYQTFFIEEAFLGPKVHSTSDICLWIQTLCVSHLQTNHFLDTYFKIFQSIL